MSEFKRITLPMTHEQARELKAGELVLADGELALTIGLPTHRRMLEYLDAGKPLPIDMKDQSLFHLGFAFAQADGKLKPLYVNPSTSTRFNALMPDLIRKLRLSAVGGKGGLSPECAEAMREVGCVYLSIVGGASSLVSAAVLEVIDSAWDDLIMQFRLTRIRVKGLGPLTVGIDAHGGSVYQRLADQARARLPGILERLRGAEG